MAAIRFTITLDLAHKTVAEERIMANPDGSLNRVRSVFPQGTVTQIADQQVIFVVPADVNDHIQPSRCPSLQDGRVMAACGSQNEPVPDCVLKWKHAPEVKADADRVKHTAGQE